MAKKAYVGVGYDTNEYEALQYIESTGTQVIDTGFKHNQNTRFTVDFETTYVDTSAYSYPFGSYGGSSYSDGKFFSLEIKTNATGFTSIYKNEQHTFGGTLIGKHHLDMNKMVHTLDNETYTFSSGSFSSSTNFYLFGSAKYTGDSPQFGPCTNMYFKLYSAKLYDNGTLIRDFIPVRRKSDDEICLYDLVNQQFYTNVGTGTFIAGPLQGQAARNIKKIYAGINGVARGIKRGYVGVKDTYSVLDYIQSNGTQYIDTGIIPVSTTKLVLDIAFTDITDVNRVGWASTTECLCVGLMGTSDTNFKACCSSNVNYIDVGVKDTYRHIFELSNSGILQDGVSYGVGNLGDSSTSTFLLFARNVSWSSNIQYAKCKIYSCKMYDNGNLIRDFTPVLDGNNAVCLFDKANNVAYYNQGSGSFIAGTATGETIEPSTAREFFVGYTPLSYLESNGTQYINTGVKFFNNLCTEIKFQATNLTPGYDWGIGAAEDINGSTYYYLPIQKNNNVSYFSAHKTTSNTDTNTWTADTNVHTVKFAYRPTSSSSPQYNWDGTSKGNLETYSVISTYTVPLFARNWKNYWTVGRMRIYYCKMYNSVTGEMYRDFIPVLDVSGVPCLYDKVTSEFYYNVGTGTFLYG